MPRITVRCTWRFFHTDDFYEAVRLANLLECRIWLDFPKLGEIDSEGYELIPVFIVADEDVFLRLYDRLLASYGVVSSSDAQMVEWSFVEPGPGHELAHLMRRGGFIQPLVAIACGQNRARRDEEILWFQAEWKSDWIETLNINALAPLIHDSRLVVFYKTTTEFRFFPPIKKDPRLVSIMFYFKAMKFPGLFTWLDDVQATLPVKHIILLVDYTPDRVEGGRPLDLATIQSYPQLTPETLDTFLQEIGYHA